MNYSIGIDIEDFNRREINDVEILSDTQESNRILIYVDTEVGEDKLPLYYNSIQKMFKNPLNAVLLVENADMPSVVFQPILKLFLLYGNYSVYRIFKETELNKEYALKLCKQEPTSIDVEQYISSDVVGYDQLSTNLMTLVDYIREGDMDGLSNFVQENKTTLLKYPIIFDTLKTYEVDICTGTHSKLLEAMAQIEKAERAIEEHSAKESELDNKIVVLNTELDQQKLLLTQSNEVIAGFQQQIEELSTEKANLLAQIAAGGGGGEGGGKTSLESLVGGSEQFSTVTPVKLNSIVGNKLKLVIYVKEVTRPAYINTFMMQLLNHMNKSVQRTKGNIKMVILDNKPELAQVYYPLPLLNANTYFEGDMKDRLHNKNNDLVFVFTDLNPVYLQNLATLSKFEQLIIYDRLGTDSNLFFGNAVIPFYAFSSKYTAVQYGNRHSDIKSTNLIVNDSSTAIQDAILIHRIDKYNEAAEERKRVMFLKAHQNSFKSLLSRCGY